MSDTHTGSCLCGAVTFTTNGPLRDVVYCHCSQCRKQTGHFYATTKVAAEHITIEGSENLQWYRASPDAGRGFCRTCGSALFWKRDGAGEMSVLAGSFDVPTGLEAQAHIFVADKGDYYMIDDGLPQHGAAPPPEVISISRDGRE